VQGWLVLESASVSYGKATNYLPVIDLLKGYFKIQDRDDLREIREKVTAGGAVRVVWVRQQVRHQVLWWVDPCRRGLSPPRPGLRRPPSVMELCGSALTC
jgi:hypothetical protein